MIKVILADDHQLIRDGIKLLIADELEIEIIGEADTVESLQALLNRELPDVLILDISMENRRSGLEFLETRQELVNQIEILMLSVSENISIVRRAIELGARGFLPKSETTGCLLDAIRTVAKGVLYIAPRISQQLLSGLSASSDDRSDPENMLSKREITIFSMIGRGVASKQISQELNIKPSTVSTHIENIKIKLDLVSVSELLKVAYDWVNEAT